MSETKPAPTRRRLYSVRVVLDFTMPVMARTAEEACSLASDVVTEEPCWSAPEADYHASPIETPGSLPRDFRGCIPWGDDGSDRERTCEEIVGES
jgi:hypothetical protein